jgi:hypothetical protein
MNPDRLRSAPWHDRARLAACLLGWAAPLGERVRLAQVYLTGRLQPPHADQVHLEAALAWLARAQDVHGGRGVAAVYRLRGGWDVPYPETSGYIIGTFIAYAELAGDDRFAARARAIADWEIDIQAGSGGVLSNPAHEATRVFNTGQVILGWCVVYERTGEGRYLEAAARAGDYLVRLQEGDGAWRRDTYCGARTYHARVDWALLRLAQLTGEGRFAAAALRNLEWVLRQQRANGWFDACGFHDDDPILHVIVYTLRGLLEAHLTGIPPHHGMEILHAVTAAADPLVEALLAHPVMGIPGMAAASFDRNWQTRDQHSCLTGNAQLACFLFRLAHVTGKSTYRDVGELLVDATKRTQWIDTPVGAVRGAVPGSYPIYRGYCRNSFPNWGTKFIADALMMKMAPSVDFRVEA